MNINFPLIFSFVFYLFIILIIGLIAYKNTHSSSDYILGGRKLGPKVTALSVGASDMSGWLLLGLPGAIYLSGLTELWIGVGLVVGAYINWQFVATKIRRFTYNAENALTIPDYLAKRFSEEQVHLRFFAALVILVFFTFYIASGLVSGAILFEKVFDISYTHSLLIGTAVIVSYTFFGGYLAVSWTDFFQGILMLLALILIPVIALVETSDNQQAVFELITLDSMTGNIEFLSLISLLAWGLGYFGQPHILSRFMAIDKEENITQAKSIAMSWMILSLFGAVLVGLSAKVLFQEPLANPETAFIQLTHLLVHPYIAGILIAAILSAVMSTIDSQLLVCSSILTKDVAEQMIKKKFSESQLIWISRITVVLIAGFALNFAFNPESSILDLVSYAWAGLGCSLGSVILFSLFWKRMTAKGAIAGIIVGGFTVILWKPLSGGLFDLYEMVPGFLFSSLAIVLTSLLDKQHQPKAIQLYERLNTKINH